jgi:hypothetical protein
MNPKILFSLLSCLFIAQFQCKSQCAFTTIFKVLHPDCLASGSITTLVSGGSGNYHYQLDSNGIPKINYNSNNTFLSLYPGTYQVKVKDLSTGCISTFGVILDTNAANLHLQITPTPIIQCNDAKIFAHAGGGNLPYTFMLTSTSSPTIIVSNYTKDTITFSNLAAGKYIVSVTDFCGHIRVDDTTIQPKNLIIQYDSTTKTACNVYKLDSIKINPLLPASTYTVTIKQGSTVLGTSTILPISFTNPDATIDSVTLEVSYCGVTISKKLNKTYTWKLKSADLNYTVCDTFTATNFILEGNPVLPLEYGILLLPSSNYTLSLTSPNYSFANPSNTYTTGKLFIKDACGIIQFAPGEKELTMSNYLTKTFTSCSTTTVQVIPKGSFLLPIQYSLNGSPYDTTSTFTNKTDGIYTLHMVDACNDTFRNTFIVDHSWDSDGNKEIHCDSGFFRDWVNIMHRMKPPIVIKRYRNSYATLVNLDTVTYAPFNANKLSTDIYSRKYYFNSMPDSTYFYVLVDACNDSDTVIIPHGPITTPPPTLQGSYSPKCYQKGNLHATYNYYGSTSNSLFLSLYNVQNLSTPIQYQVAMPNFNGIYTWFNLDTGTYIIHMQTSGCPIMLSDTVTIEPYSIPQFQYISVAYSSLNTVTCSMQAYGGVPTYRYEVVHTVPAGMVIGLQLSSTFTFIGAYDSVRLRVIDDCNNGTASTEYIQPFQFALPLSQLVASASLENFIPKIKWLTIDEKNITDFTIERSLDGIHFEKINTRLAAGNTIGETHYSYLDQDALLLNTSILYYRIIANDISNATYSSNIVSVRMRMIADQATIFPTPFSDKLTIQYVSTHTQKIICTLFDCTGRLLHQQQNTVHSGTTNISMAQLDKLKRGTYICAVENNTSNRMVKIVVKE